MQSDTAVSGRLQLHQVLYSKVWEARVAASEALALIAAAIAHWTVLQLTDVASRAATGSAPCAAEVLAQGHEAQVLQSFNVRSVLSSGRALLCDDGQVRHQAHA